MLPDFDLLTPRTLQEALEILADRAPEVAPLAGGTNVIVGLREGHPYPPVLVDISRLEDLRFVRLEEGRVVVGGGTTMAALLEEPLIARHGGPLREAAAQLGNPLVRSRATLAGNLADGSPAADTAPPLLVLGAEVELASREGVRRVPLADFITGPGETVRRPDELLVAVRWPLPPEQSAAGFFKLGLRRADAIAVVNGAALVVWDEGGDCLEARIGLGAVAPRPFRAAEAEAALTGRPLTPETIAEAARLAAQAARPIDDIRGSASYRRRVTEVLVRRMLTGLGAKAD